MLIMISKMGMKEKLTFSIPHNHFNSTDIQQIRENLLEFCYFFNQLPRNLFFSVSRLASVTMINYFGLVLTVTGPLTKV